VLQQTAAAILVWLSSLVQRAAAAELVIRREDTVMPQACPECGLINPPDAQRCDCGYDFASRTMQQSYSGTNAAASSRSHAILGGCVRGLLGAFLGVVMGGLIGRVAAPPPPPGPPAGGFSTLGEVFNWIDAAGAAAEVATRMMLLGAGMGAIIGGMGGTVLGAWLAARASSRPTGGLRSPMASRSATLPQPPTESADAELARLKELVAELEAKKRGEDVPSAEKGPS
jgi:hypothetical protein